MKNKLAFTLREKIARIFVLRHYLFLEAHRKIVCIFKQVMSAGKQQCIFSRQIEVIVYLASHRELRSPVVWFTAYGMY